MRALFVDTSGFYAFLDRTDPNHGSAVSLFTLAIEKGWELVTTNYVVHESWALIQARLGWDAVDAWSSDILPRCRTEWVDATLHNLGAERCRQARERSLSLTDSVSLACMARLGLRHAIAFDRHFTQAGIQPPGSWV